MTDEEQYEVIEKIADEVIEERISQLELWGPQDWPSFFGETDLRKYAAQASYYKQMNDARALESKLCWDTILLEEVFEALSEPDPALRRAELIQVAAVAAAEIESLDRLIGEEPDPEPGEDAEVTEIKVAQSDKPLKVVVTKDAGDTVIIGDFDTLKDAA